MLGMTSTKMPVTMEVLRSLHAICTAAHVDYVVLGGAACVALGSARTTLDVDIVVKTEGGDYESKVKAIQAAAGERFTVGVSEIGGELYKLDGAEVEIFVPSMWPFRPQYGEFLGERGHAFIGGCYVVSPPLLLREKLVTIAERSGQKIESDKADIEFLLSYCKQHGYTLDLRGNDSISVTARKGMANVAERVGGYSGVVIQ